jgi:hypothetical protein
MLEITWSGWIPGRFIPKTVALKELVKGGPHLNGDALLVIKSETAVARIYWNGKRYVWLQQGD